MSFTSDQILSFFKQKNKLKLLSETEHALERECLRVDEKGKLAMTPHPKAFGSPLTHPYISMDFSEAQLELITPIFKSEAAAIQFLDRLHRFIYDSLPKERLWSSSSPCVLPDEEKIPLAQFGSSESGRYKHLYRQGLKHRYGSKMQTFSGIHYNFSLSNKTLEALRKKFNGDENFISQCYLKAVRNFLRWGWLNTYLFGASPVVDSSFQKADYPFATSLRMSDIGYYSKVQMQCPISFNSLPEYIRDLKRAISTPYPPFHAIDEQINDHILQIEAEHYSRIRPKPPLNPNQTPLEALSQKGITYLEVRGIDIDPFAPSGVCEEQLQFLHVFLLFCLFEKSPSIAPRERKKITDNQLLIAYEGRKPNLKLLKKGELLLNKMEPVAALLDQAYQTKKYSQTIQKQRKKLRDPTLTPSGRIAKFLKNQSFRSFSLNLAEKNRLALLKKKPLPRLESITKESLMAQKEIEDQDLELSTQMIIQEAKNRNIKVEILDRKDNFIRLTKGEKQEYIKQASITSKDTQISHFLMENKQISKQILQENNIPTPVGKLYNSVDEAISDRKSFRNMKVAIKPNFTNFGIGISFVKASDKKQFETCVKEAFKYSNEVIIEEFVEGDEFRFLVIDGKITAVCQRMPANVIGDGKHSVTQLVKMKNKLKFPKYRIKLGPIEKGYLKDQRLTTSSIPKKGKRVLLREMSNVSTGGDAIDVTDKIPAKFKKAALKAVKTLDVTFCGLDMMINGNDFSIVELNFNPALFMHRYPFEGKAQHVEKAVLDTLGF